MTNLLFTFVLSHALYAAAEPTHVFVVRHAERAAEPKDDPALTAEGVMRAELLAETLAASNVRVIITTQRLRTQQSAAALAKRLGITPVVIPTRPGAMAAHVDEVIAEARKASGVILVVGHSNTVARIIAGLQQRARGVVRNDLRKHLRCYACRTAPTRHPTQIWQARRGAYRGLPIG
jgi:phosphohistidine phosphatase SixA